MHAFRGSDDTVLQGFNAEPDLADALAAGGVYASVVAGTDHVTTVFDTDVVMSALSGTGP